MNNSINERLNNNIDRPRSSLKKYKLYVELHSAIVVMILKYYTCIFVLPRSQARFEDETLSYLSCHFTQTHDGPFRINWPFPQIACLKGTCRRDRNNKKSTVALQYMIIVERNTLTRYLDRVR